MAIRRAVVFVLFMMGWVALVGLEVIAVRAGLPTWQAAMVETLYITMGAAWACSKCEV